MCGAVHPSMVDTCSEPSCVLSLLLCVSHPGRCDGDDWWLAVLKRVMDEGCYVLAEIMKDWGADVHIQMCVCDRSH